MDNFPSNISDHIFVLKGGPILGLNTLCYKLDLNKISQKYKI